MGTVFELWYEREYEYRDDTELKIGIYATKLDALAAVNQLKDKSGFCEDIAGFKIYETKLGNTGWQEGFITETYGNCPTVAEAVASRRSIRAFLDKPVPQDLLQRVLERAQMAPSGYNFQPWEAVVLSGDSMRELSVKLKAATPQEPAEYQLVPRGLPQFYKDRRDATVEKRMAAAGIARNDEAGRAAFQQRNFEFYGAPAVLLTFIPRVMGPPQWSDVGMWLQTLMLLLHGEGLDTCAQESLFVHARLIKDYVGVSDETHLFFCGMAIGWADKQAPVNNFERTRAPMDEVVRFIGFR